MAIILVRRLCMVKRKARLNIRILKKVIEIFRIFFLMVVVRILWMVILGFVWAGCWEDSQ